MVEDAAGCGVAVERDGFAGAGGEGRGRDDGAVGEALDVNNVYIRRHLAMKKQLR